jgi:hypothetical protein
MTELGRGCCRDDQNMFFGQPVARGALTKQFAAMG